MRTAKRIAIAWLLAVCAASGVAAQPIVVRATVDRNHVTLEDQVVLEVRVEGQLQSVDEPERPPMADFEVYFRGRSQNIQIVNGRMDASHTFTYLLLPKREGNLVIGPFTLKHKGQTYTSAPIQLTVGGTPPDAVHDDEVAERDLYVVARIDKQTAYVNEQILYTFSLYAAVRVSNLNYTQPGFEGFWVEKLQEGEKQYHKIINGRRYLVIEVQTAIFPTTSGTMQIEPGRLRLVEIAERSFRSFFDQGVEKVLRARPMSIEVLPLPVQGRPADFDGAVGEGLSISAQLDRTEVPEGEPVTLSVAVEGSGTVRTFSKPRLPDLPQFKIYDADSKTNVRALESVEGTRSYEIVLVPTQPGEYTLPPVRLSYFDTREAKYRSIETKPLELTAVRTAQTERMAQEGRPRRPQDIQVLGKDIAHIRTDVPVADTRTPLYARALVLAALPLPVLALVAVWFDHRRRLRFAQDVALARSTRARKAARKRLSTAAKLLGADKGGEFYTEIARAMQQYVGDKLNVSAFGLTHEALRRQLHDAGVREDERERLIQVLEHCDAARFAPGGMTKARMQDVLAEAETLLAQIEGRIEKRMKSGTAAAVALCVLVGTVPGTLRAQVTGEPATIQQGPGDFASPQQVLQEAHAAYERGDFAAAIQLYERAEALGVRNGPLYFDLGNAYFKSNRLGLAIASYRRAERLMPRDVLVHENLEHALSMREDKAVQPGVPFVVAWVRSVYRWLSLNEWFLVTSACYLLAAAFGILRIRRRGGAFLTRVALRTAIVLLILSGSMLATKVRSEQRVERGVIAVDKVPVTSGPGEDYTAEFWLHEGTEVVVEVERPDWLRISVNKELRGWVPAGSVEQL
jgi:tetratricopeptide (TPR) repeat protein